MKSAGYASLNALCLDRGATLMADDHFADLDYRRLVSIVRNVGHDLLGVRPEAGLEGLDGVAEDVAHADISRGSAGGAAGEALVDGVVLAGIAHARLHQ